MRTTSPVMVSHAEVSVQDENGVITLFQENEPGIYLSDPDEFTGRVGGTYSLQIRTEDGLEYISDACTMTAVPRIDSLYYEPDSEFYENGTIEEAGLRVYLDTDNRDEACPYMRWEFEEIWKFRVPYPLFWSRISGIRNTKQSMLKTISAGDTNSPNRFLFIPRKKKAVS